MNAALHQVVPCVITKKVRRFCEQLAPSQIPVYIPVRPEAQAVELECYGNVLEKVRTSGGECVYGWEISEVPQIFLEAQFHAVWRSPDGELVDVTPPQIEAQRVLFLPDPGRVYEGVKVANQRFAIGNAALAERYWKLSDHLIERFSSFEIGLPGLRVSQLRRNESYSL